MNEIELYNEIGKWINRFHRRDWYYTGLLKDFQHDLWERIRDKEQVNTSYIKQRCYYYPLSAITYLYYKRNRDFSPKEVVILDENGGYVDIPDYPFTVELEIPVRKINRRTRVNQKKVTVLFVNGDRREFDCVKDLADELKVNTQTIYHRIGKPLAQRFHTRKMSHVKQIDYADNQPLYGEQVSDGEKDNKENTRSKSRKV
ncbi:MAG TPA: hypothetical protein VD927_06305 [Chryseosolibacter sp.]|nr:hypothetical protein [Chryseosolibacter sp.]